MRGVVPSGGMKIGDKNRAVEGDTGQLLRERHRAVLQRAAGIHMGLLFSAQCVTCSKSPSRSRAGRSVVMESTPRS